MKFVPKPVQVNFNKNIVAIGMPAEIRGSGDKYTIRGWSTDGTTVLVENEYGDAETYDECAVVLLVEGKASVSSIPDLSFFKTELSSRFVYVKGFNPSGGICTINCAQLADVSGDRNYDWCSGVAVFRSDSRVFPVELIR